MQLSGSCTNLVSDKSASVYQGLLLNSYRLVSWNRIRPHCMTGTSHYLHIIQLNRELCGSQVGCRPYLAAGESSAAALGFRGGSVCCDSATTGVLRTRAYLVSKQLIPPCLYLDHCHHLHLWRRLPACSFPPRSQPPRGSLKQTSNTYRKSPEHGMT